MAIYHISADGVARRCLASDPSGCRVKLGASIEHYDTKEEAQSAYEKSQEKETFFKLSKNPAENTERHYKNISDDNNPAKKRQKANRERYENASAEEKARIDKANERYNRETEAIAAIRKPATDNLRALNKSLREANYELIELEDKYETAWNDRRKEIEIEISDKKAEIKEIEQQVKEAKRKETTSKPVKRTSLDISAEHLETSRQIDELIAYNNSNRKKDFVFKHNDPSYAEKPVREQSKVFSDLADKEYGLKKEFKDSKAQDKEI